MIRYVMTEAANVTRFLSFGCLGPTSIHGDRYRQDVSSEYGGAMVLLKDPSGALDAVLSAKDATPVAIVVEDLFGGDDENVVSGSLMPAASIRRLHFRDRKEMKEFRSIGYQNVDPAAFESVESPHLFRPSVDAAGPAEPVAVAAQTSLDVDAATESGASPVEVVTVERLERLDRLVGALAAVLAPGMPTRGMVEHIANTMLVAVSKLGPVEHTFAENFVPAEEHELHTVVSECIIALPHTQTGHELLLDAIVARHESAAPQVSAIGEMLGAKRDFDREALESVCMRGLLAALARPSPEEVGDAQGEGAPGEQERLIAQWYSGLRRGGSRRPVATRLSAVEPLLQRWLASQGSAGRPPRLSEPPSQVDVEARVAENAFEYRYVIDGERSSPIVRSFPSDHDRIARAVRDDWRTAVRIADAVGVTVTTIIHLDGPSPIQLESSPFLIRIDAPHRLDRKVDAEEVVTALERLEPTELRELARRFVRPPEEAP